MTGYETKFDTCCPMPEVAIPIDDVTNGTPRKGSESIITKSNKICSGCGCGANRVNNNICFYCGGSI